jgi:hypothetical protein
MILFCRSMSFSPPKASKASSIDARKFPVADELLTVSSAKLRNTLPRKFGDKLVSSS